MRSIIPFLFLLLACAGPAPQVKIPHLLALSEGTVKIYPQLDNVLLVINYKKRPVQAGMNLISSDLLARAVKKQMARFDGDVTAYVMFKDKKHSQNFIKALKPKSILSVDFQDISSDSVKSTQVNIDVFVQLRNQQDNDVLKEFTHTSHFSNTSTGTAVPNASNQLAEEIVNQLIQIDRVESTRPLFFKRSDPDSVRAYELALQAEWTTAENIWRLQQQTIDDSWEVDFNLGVAAESQYQLDTALQHYKTAQQKSGDDKRATQIDWDGIVKTLSSSLAPPVSDEKTEQGWFSQSVAVLPFQDRSGNEDASRLLRQLVADKLNEGGYTVMPLDEIDKKLTERGYIKSGKLKPVLPSRLAEHLSADKLLFGKVDKFNQDTIAGRLSVWAGPNQNWIWNTDEKARGAEAALFVNQSLESFPLSFKQ